MSRRATYFHRAVTAFATSFLAAQAFAEPADPALFETLARKDGDAWMEAETRILTAWADTGSEALNLIQSRGESAIDEGDFPAAIGHLTALLDHAPDHAMGYQLRALAYWSNGDYGPAAADLAQALALEPKQYLALAQLSAILDEIGNSEGALAAVRLSLEINPHQQDVIDAVRLLDTDEDGTDI